MASAAADHVYHGLGSGNSDLSTNPDHDNMVGVQPGVGDSIDIYRDFAVGNSDLFTRTEQSGGKVENPDKRLPQIYREFQYNSDLNW